MRWIGQHIWDLISRFRNYVYLEKVDTSISTTALVVDPDGRIGTTAPSEKLEVNEGYILSSGSGTSHGFELERVGYDIYQIRHLDGGLTINNATDGRKEMTFDGSGNVGIGTTSPDRPLTVVAATTTAPILTIRNTNTSTSADVYIGFNRDGSTGSSGWSTGIDSTTNDFHISEDADTIGNNVRLCLEAGGNIGIGTTTPDEKLHVAGSIKMVDGNEGVGKVLTSDANGVGAWATPTGTGGAMFAVSGMENSFNEDRWLIPRRYKLAVSPTGTSNGDYLSGASEDLSAVEMANIDFVTHLRLETFVSDGVLQPVRYEVYIVMQQTALDANVEFGIFETNPTNGDSDITYTFTSYGSTQPYGTADRIKKISGTISDTLTAGTICSFGFHNPSGTPATQDIDDLRYWITVYFN